MERIVLKVLFFAVATIIVLLWWNGNAVSFNVLAGIALCLCGFCLFQAMTAQRSAATLAETRHELKTANWLLKLSVTWDKTGTAKALDQKARELKTAFQKQEAYQSLSTHDRLEQYQVGAEVIQQVETAKKCFWELVGQAKSAGFPVRDGVPYTNFILPERKAA